MRYLSFIDRKKIIWSLIAVVYFFLEKGKVWDTIRFYVIYFTYIKFVYKQSFLEQIYKLCLVIYSQFTFSKKYNAEAVILLIFSVTYEP